MFEQQMNFKNTNEFKKNRLFSEAVQSKLIDLSLIEGSFLIEK